MRVPAVIRLVGIVLALVATSAPGRAHTQPANGAPTDSATREPAAEQDMEMHHDMGGMDMSGMDISGMAMSGMNMSDMEAPMHGMYGPYTMSREASGTAWQPDAANHMGVHFTGGDWMLMVHGAVDVVADRQGGPRGGDRIYSSNMVMGMAQRPLGAGTLGLRSMLSIEPATIGSDGYPLLLQTGETADGVTPLIDRQHPHDLFMELAGSYSVSSGHRSLFVYAGLPGEPALGPPAFMHRFSGMNVPQAPITHHWLDSTHITYGVLTAGAVVDGVKLEASAFRGREPDQHRWDIETPKLDSHAFRLSVNPAPAWALQASYGRLASPEQLEPDVDQDRTTASVTYDRRWNGGHWEGTVAWGRTRNQPGHTLDAFTAEAAARVGDAHTLMVHAEHVQKDELFVAPDPRVGTVFDVGDASLGYRHDFWRRDHVAAGLGALGTLSFVPSALHDTYGTTPASVLLFAHLELR